MISAKNHGRSPRGWLLVDFVCCSRCLRCLSFGDRGLRPWLLQFFSLLFSLERGAGYLHKFAQIFGLEISHSVRDESYSSQTLENELEIDSISPSSLVGELGSLFTPFQHGIQIPLIEVALRISDSRVNPQAS